MTLRIANISGFFGDRDSAASELLQRTSVDVLTGDYLAELTMFLLWKQRQRDPSLGYARTLLSQCGEYLEVAADRGTKIITNAGGLNPSGLAAALCALGQDLGVKMQVAHIEGDDLVARLGHLRANGEPLEHLQSGGSIDEHLDAVVTANAYLGCWPIVECLRAGSDIVVCPRVADAALVTGPAAWRFGWTMADLDQLAAATVAGHIIECGPQASGGNHSLFHTIADLRRPGFPIIEMEPDGRFVVTKAPGTGGAVTVATVTEQLLYEVDSPRYQTPDVIARFDTIELQEDGEDRVLVSGIRGEAPPSTLKVAVNYLGGYRNSMTCILTGPRIPEKAALVESALRTEIPKDVALDFQLVPSGDPDSCDEEVAASRLRVVATATDAEAVGRRFSSAVTSLALSSYPGFFTTAPPSGATAFGVLWPTSVARNVVEPVAVLPDATRVVVPHPVYPASAVPPTTLWSDQSRGAPAFEGPRSRVRLGCLVGARSGDKGGDANVGVWARSERVYQWLLSELDESAFTTLVPSSKTLRIERHAFDSLRAVNFVVRGLLGLGVAASTRFDPQAKSLGEHLRHRWVVVPDELLTEEHLVDESLLIVAATLPTT